MECFCFIWMVTLGRITFRNYIIPPSNYLSSLLISVSLGNHDILLKRFTALLSSGLPFHPSFPAGLTYSSATSSFSLKIFFCLRTRGPLQEEPVYHVPRTWFGHYALLSKLLSLVLLSWFKLFYLEVERIQNAGDQCLKSTKNYSNETLITNDLIKGTLWV